jgi:hypothetical protein
VQPHPHCTQGCGRGQFASSAITGAPPEEHTRPLLQMKNYLTDDWDGHLDGLRLPPLTGELVAPEAIKIKVGPGGEILGKGKYQGTRSPMALVGGHEVPFLAASTICWGEKGHLGIRFISLSEEHKSELQGWLARQQEKMIPQFVAGKFQRAEGCSLPISADRERD